MKRIKRYDELPHKLQVFLNMTFGSEEQAKNLMNGIKIFECMNKDEVYKKMKDESLEPATLLDKDPMQGRFFFVALGLPDRRAKEDLILFNPVERTDTVLYFAQMTPSETKEVLDDERKAREYYRNKTKNIK